MSKRDAKGCAAGVLLVIGILLAISLPSSCYRRWHRDGYHLTEATILWPPESTLRSGSVRIASTGEEIDIRKTTLDAKAGTEPVWYNPNARLVIGAEVFDERVVSAKRHPELGSKTPAVVQLVHTFTHSAPARRIAFSLDSTLLATTSVDATLKLWRVGDRQLVHTLKHPIGVTAAAFSSAGQFVVSASYDGALRVWRVADGTLVRTIDAHEGTIWTVAVSADGRIASAGEDKTIRLWRLVDGAPLAALKGHTLNVWSVAFSPDARTLVSGSFDHSVKLWRTDTGALVRTLAGHEQAVVGVDFAPNGELIASGGDDSAVRIWRASDGTLLRTLQGGSDHVYTVGFSADSRLLASGGRGQNAVATLWKQVFGGSGGKTVRIWRVEDGALLQVLTAHGGNVFSVAFSGDGQWLATGSEDHTVKLWRVVRRQASAFSADR